jgi:hypothetical protein
MPSSMSRQVGAPGWPSTKSGGDKIHRLPVLVNSEHFKGIQRPCPSLV